MHKSKFFLPLGLLLSVAACSPAPSNKDIEQAFQDSVDQASNMASNIIGNSASAPDYSTDISIKNSACKKEDAGRYRCSFTMSMNNPLLGEQTYEQSGVFVKRDGRWHVGF